jgi:hypothetical protein
MKAKINPIGTRAKNRVREHGDTFEVVKLEDTGVCCQSLNNTHKGMKWLGWFFDDEATWEITD